MKPWEQDWKRSKFLSTDVVDANGKLVVEIPEDVSYTEAIAVAEFITAAPAMARRLIARTSEHGQPCPCEDCEVLRFAGALE